MAGIPADSKGHRQQQKAEDQGRYSLIAGMAVGVVAVVRLHRVIACQQDEGIGEQVGERVDAVGDQGLGVSEQARGNLEDAQD